MSQINQIVIQLDEQYVMVYYLWQMPTDSLAYPPKNHQNNGFTLKNALDPFMH